MTRPGSPLENRLQDIAFAAVFGEGAAPVRLPGLETTCPQCGKTVKAVGLKDHMRDKHERNGKDRE